LLRTPNRAAQNLTGHESAVPASRVADLRCHVEANRCLARVRGTRWRLRLIEGDCGEALLAVFNDSRKQQLTDRISVPPEYRTQMDIDSSEGCFDHQRDAFEQAVP
jgi:hypothetical protein